VLTTTGLLLMGGGAALLGALFQGSASAAQTPDVLLVLGTAIALTLARGPRRP
jgi:hypothetical protein